MLKASPLAPFFGQFRKIEEKKFVRLFSLFFLFFLLIFFRFFDLKKK